MPANYFEDEKFENQKFSGTDIINCEYEVCTFRNCSFDRADLSETKFMECEFSGCNFSNAKTSNTSFRDIRFINCKMLGLRFDECNEFGLSFEFDKCILNHSTFIGLKIMNTLFKETKLIEVDFTGSDLTGSVFIECDLSRAFFNRTILEKADLKSAYNFSIDPESNRLKKARFSLHGLEGLLDKYGIIVE